MILWGRASSVNVQKVLWALEDCALPYEHKIVGGIFGGNDDPEFAVLTPVRRVPVLQDGDITLWESHAILRYLARGQISPITDMWMEFGSTTLQPPFIGLFWQQVRMRKAEQDKALLKKHIKALHEGLSILETGLAGGRTFLAGDDFSMADIAIGSLFHRIMDLHPAILDTFPKVGEWHANIATRAGYRKWVGTPFDELRVTE
ncbi:glutathione S-transferase family protein [Planktomarina temperata]|nr:glutathione S-transferase family protein [Planktomarina temperata]